MCAALKTVSGGEFAQCVSTKVVHCCLYVYGKNIDSKIPMFVSCLLGFHIEHLKGRKIEIFLFMKL